MPGQRLRLSITLLLFASWLVSCSRAGPPTQFPSTPNYPVPEASTGIVATPAGNGYPGPDNIEDTMPRTPEPPLDAPQPIAGQASISGVLYSYTVQRALPGTQFFLTQAVGKDNRGIPPLITGPEGSHGDIVGQTNAKGQFNLPAIPPGNYYMFVWSPSTWAAVQTSLNDQTPRLLELAANQRLPLGIAYVAWP